MTLGHWHGLVGLVCLIERAQAAAGPLPELRDVGIVVDDRLSRLRRSFQLDSLPVFERQGAWGGVA
jgi:hypothetical protein